jgi:hypothetical protein
MIQLVYKQGAWLACADYRSDFFGIAPALGVAMSEHFRHIAPAGVWA